MSDITDVETEQTQLMREMLAALKSLVELIDPDDITPEGLAETRALIAAAEAAPVVGYHDELSMRLRLSAWCSRETQRGVAKRLGFSSAFICDVLAGRRAVTADLAEAMGYRRVVLFRRAS